jgi:hypothetical protein
MNIASPHQHVKTKNAKKPHSTAHRVQNNLAYRLQQDSPVPYAHFNTGSRRNPGRNDGFTWKGNSFNDTDYSYFVTSTKCCYSCEQSERIYNQEAQVRRPRTTVISLADVPMKVRKPKRRA